jgi:hypothetical protein
MALNPIVVMLYLELGLFLTGIGCLTVARMLELFDEASATRKEAGGEERGRMVLSRLGT